MKVVILYEELSGYFLSCINKFAEKYSADIFIFRKEVNSEAPFLFSNYPRIYFFCRDKFSQKKIILKVNEIRPDAIFCGGWSARIYMNVCRLYAHEIPVILGFDNKWVNSIKQNIASILSPLIIRKRFNVCWVPGVKQMEYAKRLGFKEECIFLNAYSADFNLFHSLFLDKRYSKQNSFPRRFIFTGRYYDFKGIGDLWNAFIELQNENPNDWELWCLGTGNIKPIVHPKIKHFGFVQPIFSVISCISGGFISCFHAFSC